MSMARPRELEFLGRCFPRLCCPSVRTKEGGARVDRERRLGGVGVHEGYWVGVVC
jgi:hypothetical protein